MLKQGGRLLRRARVSARLVYESRLAGSVSGGALLERSSQRRGIAATSASFVRSTAPVDASGWLHGRHAERSETADGGDTWNCTIRLNILSLWVFARTAWYEGETIDDAAVISLRWLD